MIFGNVLDTIGRTPVVRLSRIADDVYVKLESRNPGGSIKDRAVLHMIRDAEQNGKLKKGGTIVEPTSGNTGIAISMAAAALGYKAVIVMPDSMSRERSEIMSAYGAEVITTPGEKGMAGAVNEAERICSERNAITLGQFANPANAMSHYLGTAKEILEDLPDVKMIVAGIGTGGTVTGVGMAMREFSRPVKVIGVEPYESPMITEGRSGKHMIQGIGANFVPELLDLSVIDQVVTVKGKDAETMVKRLAAEEGILAGLSSGAVVSAAVELSRESDGKIVAILADSGERYMSTGMFG